MSYYDVQQTMLVVCTDSLQLRRRFVDVESADKHLSDVGEIQRVLKECDGDGLLDGRTVPGDHSPEMSSLHEKCTNNGCTCTTL